MTPEQLHILHHAIGAPKHQALCTDPYRNRYVTSGPSADCEELVEAGLMVRGSELGGMVGYHVTPAGIEAVRETLPKLRAWNVQTSAGGVLVFAATRGKARAIVARMALDSAGGSWVAACRLVGSVREVKP